MLVIDRFTFSYFDFLCSDLLLPKCVKIVSINIPLDDPTKAEQNYGLHADKKRAVLTSKPGIFKIHEGLSVENGTVSLESIYHPGYFLRHKNYQFHLEKKENKSIFSECCLLEKWKDVERYDWHFFCYFTHGCAERHSIFHSLL